MKMNTCVNPDCEFYHTNMTGPDGKDYTAIEVQEDGYPQPYCIWCGGYLQWVEIEKIKKAKGVTK